VTVNESQNTGTKWLEFKLTSQDTGAEFTQNVFLPKPFAENPRINPTDLAAVPPEGKKMSERDQYAANVANNKFTEAKDEALRARVGDAVIQNYLYLAAKQGRTPTPGSIDTLEDYANLLNSRIAGIDGVILLGPEREDPDSQFGARLEVKRFIGVDDVTDKSPKPYNAAKNSGYQRLWEDNQ
jgi:hypothetical protein